MPEPVIVAAAGAVVLRRRGGDTEVLVIHRPRYDDWSFPKGKLDPGEDARTAAVREVHEETGVHIRLGPPLPQQVYVIGNGNPRVKVVHYWVGRARESDDVTGFEPNDEVDQVRWVGLEKARKLLTYDHDKVTLAEARAFERRSYPLVVLRHAAAHDKKAWKKDDRERPLAPEGARQAEKLPPTLAAYGVQRLLSSSSRRCWTTLSPYGVQVDRDIEVTDALSQEDASEAGVAEEVQWLVDLEEPAVVCSHRPVLPKVFEALGIDPRPLATAAMVVVHLRHGRIVALEHVPPPA